MSRSKILVGLVLIIYALFAVFLYSGKDVLAFSIKSLLFPTIAITYFICIPKKTMLFILFLIFYALSELLDLLFYNLSDAMYYISGNALYILAYVMLILKIWRSMTLKYVLKHFKIHIIVLGVLNIYLVYVLQVLVKSYLTLSYEYVIELIYNIVMLVLLSSALLNYLYRDNKKSLFIFVGSLLIVFSEVISLAYMYIYPTNTLHLLVVSLTLLAFYFFYQQSKLTNNKPLNPMLVE